MAESAGVQRYKAFSSTEQMQQRANTFDNGFAPKTTAPPARLSKVLYFPANRNSDFSLQLHDISAEYHHTIRSSPLGGCELTGDAVMGNRLLFTRLATIKKPQALSTSAKYATGAYIGATEAAITKRRVGDRNEDRELEM
ncbi:hypothetical protein VFPPC_13997 [Pochonia chlamydosporia 170]|uniref:Uncharacterized protein n=1 Tax=Pochonia chlamydosporia 170 TaxID=1380566 RepID=A0A179FIJ9_METCM|nr:hypothetical protein VFPPC_13997 [Pochonia chlamydosporia 170]OAQ65110.1 hypothetical protein VFPPC_13997 [Pochonia chlamydosporia 170]